MFPFIPYRRFQILTRLNQNQAIEILGKDYSPKVELQHGVETVTFNFRADQTILGSNSFRPMVYVKYQLETEGVHVRITMMMHTFTIIFCVIWLGILAIFFLVIGLGRLQENDIPLSLDSQLFLMLIFFYAIISLGFVPEAIKQERHIRNLFSGYEAL